MGNEMVIVRNPANLKLWQERFSECRRSGMTVAAWCEKQGISDKTYYYWHRKLSKLQNHTRDEASSTFYEISGNINNIVAFILRMNKSRMIIPSFFNFRQPPIGAFIFSFS